MFCQNSTFYNKFNLSYKLKNGKIVIFFLLIVSKTFSYLKKSGNTGSLQKFYPQR